MHRLILILFCAAAVVETPAAPAARITKVLPQYLDQQGRASLSPSLFERDAYQVRLRENPELRSTIRFHVRWTGTELREVKKLLIRIEVRGSDKHTIEPHTVETGVKRPRWFARWSELELDKETYANLGDVIAWRATLWGDGKQIAEKKSFLWEPEAEAAETDP